MGHAPQTSPPSDWMDPPAGCEPANPFPGLAVADSFLSGDKNPQLMRLKYYRRASDRRLLAKVWFGPQAEGPPGHAHGGSMAAVMDEGMGAAAWLAGYPVVVAKISVNFRNKLPLGTVATLETEIERIEGRKIFTRARLSGNAQDGSRQVFCDGDALLVVIQKGQFPR